MKLPYTPSSPGSSSRALARSLLQEACRSLQFTGLPHVFLPPALTGRRRLWNASTVTEALQRFWWRVGRPPSRKEWREAKHGELPSVATVRKIFGSITDVYRVMGWHLPTMLPHGRRNKRLHPSQDTPKNDPYAGKETL